MAKNLSEFIPGMGQSTEMVDQCEFLFSVSKNPGSERTHAYGNGCARHCWQSNHDYQGDVDVKIFGSGGQTGGACCCMIGTPASSGAYAKFKVKPVSGFDNAFCWSTSAGGCCRPASDGGGGACYIWFKDPARSAGCINISGGFCTCTLCNAPQANLCHEVCYQSNFCRDYIGSPTAGQGSYDCRECFTQGGTIPAAQFWLDSNVTMFPKVLGFIATTECNTGGSSCTCKIVQFKNVPTVADGKKEHYMSLSFGGENCVGGTLNSCWQNHWFGACGSSDAAQYGSICVAGTGGSAASAQGGNCYCGGPEMGGAFVSFMYKLNSEIEG